MIELKERLLAGEEPRCILQREKVDLSAADERGRFLAKMAANSQKILVLTEGVIPYLSNDEVAALARNLRSHRAISQWIADYFSPAAYQYRRRKGITAVMKSAPLQFEPMDYFGFFRSLGWRAKEIRYIPEEAVRLRRPLPLAWHMRIRLALLRLILPAEKLRAMRRFMGYVVMEPGEG